MKKLFITLVVTFAALGAAVTDADAKRLGGGGSFGRQSQMSRQAAPPSGTSSNQVAPANRPAPAATPQPLPPKPASPWRNILGGALLGLGLGALLSHFGLGGAMASVISTLLMAALVIGAVVLLMRLFRGKSAAPQPGYAGDYGSARVAPDSYADGQVRTPEIGSRLDSSGRIEPQGQPFQAQPSYGGGTAVPPDFDAPSFLRHAKTYFIRLQAAWDKADINDIREFTSPEMFGELRLQLQERGASPNNTDVVSLDAELLGIETTPTDYLASVRFSGMIREAENAAAEPFQEVWNLSKPLSGQGGWVLAGIQQLA
ncbi:Tim44 domain-containing protein [Noviherbaspirillum galbum]|uniref:Tim44 domain-containing protein n=1 Tax=Noviherbaspirillum galbum TaxID=2709383 RepID=A0A6B3SXP1_9BURK|nr:Tim44-like domain-containing protein [Noviherbaspirillum galbum]NEX64355.1 Tim44 domain-containing protein [Noviherbaspirillum galbum]